jgi:putative MATE family efflux protein
MFLGNLLQALYNTVDSFWVGRFLGPEALGAVSVGFPIIFALVSIVAGLAVAATVLVSQYYGARQMDSVKRTIGNTLVILGLSSVAISIPGVLFARRILRLINTPPQVMEMAAQYLQVFIAGLIFMFLYNALSSIMRGLGDSRTPLVFLFYTTMINIALDPLMIFGIGPLPAMGVAGAAFATVIAQAISVALLFRHLSRVTNLLPRTRDQWRPDWQLTVTTFRIGLPAGAQQLMVSLGGLVITSIINTFGATTVAAFGAASRLDQFAFMPAMSTGLAVSSLVGQNIGAGKHDRVRDVVRSGLMLTGGIAAVISLVVMAAPKLLLGVFTADTMVLGAGATYLRIVAFSYVPLSLMFAVNGALRGAGDTMPTMLTTVIALWAVRVPLARTLSSIPSLGVKGVWIAAAVSPLVGFLVSYIYYRTGRWKTKAVVKRSQYPEAAWAREPELAADSAGGAS